MNNDKTGGAAFPLDMPDTIYMQSGMSLLDYFAGKAMQSLIRRGQRDDVVIAKMSYTVASEMIKARKECIKD